MDRFEIYQAEAQRVSGKRKNQIVALVKARTEGSIDPKSIKTTPIEVLADRMRWWRIWEVTAQSLASGEWSGKTAAEFLFEARDVLKVYYYHPEAWKVARVLKNDAEGHEYQMAAEMCRDEGKYWLKVAGLLGNPVLVQRAIESFKEAIGLAETGTSAQALATLEKELAVRISGGKAEINKVREAYKTVAELAPRAGGWDRAAAAAWIYMKEAIWVGSARDIQMGLNGLRTTCNRLNKSWLEYPNKELLQSLMNVSRRATAGKPDTKQFELQP